MRRKIKLTMAAVVAACAGGVAAAVPAGVFSSPPAAHSSQASHAQALQRQASRYQIGGAPQVSADAPAPGSVAAHQVGGPLMASTGVVQASGSPALPKVPASAWVIANADTGQVLAARDPHGRYGPASTLKVLTAVALLPVVTPDTQVEASKLAASQQPSKAGLIAGRSYPAADLYRAMLMASANDAAVALAEATGSEARGMTLINAEAQHLQAYDVTAKVPNGLPADGQFSSAYDEALIARQALRTPSFMTFDATRTSRFEVRPGDTEPLTNQNDLLTKYQGGIGGKIGWTRSSGATYVGMARRGGVTLIVTVLHCTSLQEVNAGEKLLTWGFANNGKVKPVGMLVPPLSGK